MWHIPEEPIAAEKVRSSGLIGQKSPEFRFRRLSGSAADRARGPGLTPLYGPAVPSQEVFTEMAVSGLVRGRDAHFWAPPA
jgi:hypothetical protein